MTQRRRLCFSQGSISIKDGKLEIKVQVAGSNNKAGQVKDMKQLSGMNLNAVRIL